MIFYLSVAFIMYHRQQILDTEEFVLPQVMTNLTLKKKEDVYDVFVRALTLKKNTPFSFHYFVVNERIFSPLIDSEELESLMVRIQKLPALPLTMSELLFYCFPGKIHCNNPFCKNCLLLTDESNIPDVTTTNRIVSNPATLAHGLGKNILIGQSEENLRTNDLSPSTPKLPEQPGSIMPGYNKDFIPQKGSTTYKGKNVNFLYFQLYVKLILFSKIQILCVLINQL